MRCPADDLSLFAEEALRAVDCHDKYAVIDLLQLLDRLYVQIFHNVLSEFLRIDLWERRAEILREHAAHDDRFVEQTVCGRSLPERRDLAASAGLSEDRYIIRISAELNDIIAHPLQ